MSPFSKTTSKVQALWNYQERNPEVAKQITNAFGKKFHTPVVTSWRSYYDSFAQVLQVLEDSEKEERLNAIIHHKGLSVFHEGDKALLTQYRKIMGPIVKCLNVLQSEESSYMGILLPNLKLLQDQLESLRNDTSIVEGQQLINYLLENYDKPMLAFKGRFSHLFHDMDLLMATALHPHFKLRVVSYLNDGLQHEIRRRVIRETGQKSEPHKITESHVQYLIEDDPFAYMKGDNKHITVTSSVEDELGSIYEAWNEVQVNYTTSLSADQFPFLQRNAWLELFIKYNSPLPATAAVQKVFSFGSEVLSSRKSFLTADNFENLVFIKGNLHLLKGKNWLSQFEKEVNRQ